MILKLFNAIIESKSKQILNYINYFYKNNYCLKNILYKIQYILYNLLLLKLKNNNKNKNHINIKIKIKNYEYLLSKLSISKINILYQISIDGIINLKNIDQKKICFLFTIFKMSTINNKKFTNNIYYNIINEI